MTILVCSESQPEIMSVFEDDEDTDAQFYVAHCRRLGVTDVTLEHITSTFEEAQERGILHREVLDSVCG